MSDVRKSRRAIDEIIDDAMRRWQEEGDLRRLQGQPLDLSDNSPTWFTNRLLKKEGFSHPAIERGRDADQLLLEANALRERLSDKSFRPSVRLVNEYRRKLEAYNQAVIAYNLGVPEIMHKRTVAISERLGELGLTE